MFYLDKLDDRQGNRNPRASATPDWPARFAELAGTTRDPRLRAYYGAGLPVGDTPLAEVPMVALDVETTGLDPVRDGIVSIGLVPMTLERIVASASRHWIVRPRVALDETSVTLHGITDSQVEEAPDLQSILSEVLEAMAGRIVVVHCRDIERQFLDRALKARIGEGIAFPTIDTMALEAELHRRGKSGFFARLFGRRELVSIRLAASRARYSLPRYGLHHALTDALATGELFQAQVAYRYRPDTRLDALWT